MTNEEADEKVVAAIAAGKDRAKLIVKHLFPEGGAYDETSRVVDRALQRLRKARRIELATTNRWRIRA